MWFKLPPGMGGISVAQQEFGPEFTDDVGDKFFRAPDHFAAALLDGTGISALSKPPEGAPPDLPQPNSPEATNVLRLTGQIENLKLHNGGLESSLAAVKAQAQDLQVRLDEARAMLSQFAEDNPKLAEELGYKSTPLESGLVTTGVSENNRAAKQ